MAQSIETLTADLPDSATHLSLDDCYRLLADRQRRLALDHLEHHDNSISLGELATHIARPETGTDPPQAKDVELVTLALHHKHLPILEEMGVIRYDAEAHLIRIQ